MMRVTALAMTAALALAACTTAPETGRQQLILIPGQQASAMGQQAIQEISANQTVSRDPALNSMVQRVGSRIVAANGGNPNQWQYLVFDDPEANAFALPGGYVGVNTGLFRIAQNEDQLAAVIAHEIAHVNANHPAERVSRETLIQAGIAGISGGRSEQFAQFAGIAGDLALSRPFSRTQEAEADAIGMTYMARAGYDPRAAIQVWQNMEVYGGAVGPEFLSTHPSHGSRIERLQAQLPQAMAIYEGAR